MYGIKLRQLRRQLGLTQRQLGTLCGVGGTTITLIDVTEEDAARWLQWLEPRK